MSSSTKEAEFILQWNGLLDFKIDENSVRRPNFQFFYGALESLLRSLNFNIESARNEAMNNPEAERLYFITFCGFVHRLYQLSDETYNFYYLDLINPNPKKSSHVLKMLFNYVKYYKMVKETVCEKAHDALSLYNEALATNNALQVKNETARKRVASMELQLGEYEKKLPQLQERVNNCLADVQLLDKEIIQKNADIKNFDSTIIKVEIKQTELSETVVSEEEYRIRLNAIDALKQELNELREVAEHVRTSNVGSCAKITELTQTLEIVNKILELQQIAHYDEFISVNSKLDLAIKEISQEEQRIKELKINLKAMVENTDEILSKNKQIEAQTDKVQIDSNAISDELIRTVSYHEKNIEVANSELLEARSRIEELERRQNFILNEVLEILRRLSLHSNSNSKYKIC